MDSTWKSALLRELYEGRTSRNRDFGRFLRPEAAAVLAGFRRLKSLARELGRPDTEVACLPVPGSEGRLLEVRRSCLRYRRAVFLEPWEFDFLVVDMGLASTVSESQGAASS